MTYKMTRNLIFTSWRNFKKLFPEFSAGDYWIFVGKTLDRTGGNFTFHDEESVRKVELLLSPYYRTLMKAHLVSIEPSGDKRKHLYSEMKQVLRITSASTQASVEVIDEPK